MRNFTRNRFPIKNLLIDSLLTLIVESTYLNMFLWFPHDKDGSFDTSLFQPILHILRIMFSYLSLIGAGY